jgi:cytoskeletal protein RodZ
MKKSGIIVICIVLLISGVLISGCTSTNTTNAVAQTTPTPAESTATSVTQTPPATSLVTTPVPTTVQANLASANQTPADKVMGVTINSAKKETNWEGSFPPKGDAVLVLDVTLKNNDTNDFAFSKNSFQIIRYGYGGSSHGASFLSSDLNSGTIPANSELTGIIVFAVLDSANMFKFTVVNSAGTVVSETDNISPS